MSNDKQQYLEHVEESLEFESKYYQCNNISVYKYVIYKQKMLNNKWKLMPIFGSKHQDGKTCCIMLIQWEPSS